MWYHLNSALAGLTRMTAGCTLHATPLFWTKMVKPQNFLFFYFFLNYVVNNKILSWCCRQNRLLHFKMHSLELKTAMRVFVTVYIFLLLWFTPYLFTQRSFHTVGARRIRWHTGRFCLSQGIVILGYSWDRVVIWQTPTRPWQNIQKHNCNTVVGMWIRFTFVPCDVFGVCASRWLCKLCPFSARHPDASVSNFQLVSFAVMEVDNHRI